MSTLHKPSDDSRSKSCQACGECLPRREFFKVGLQAAALAAVAAAFPGRAGAIPVRWTSSVASPRGLLFPLPTEDGVEIDKKKEVILVRRAGEVFAFALSCPHQRSMLRWKERDRKFQCSKHHSEYSPTGVYQKGRATRNMDRLAVKLMGDDVVVDPDTVFESDEDPQGWESAVVILP